MGDADKADIAESIDPALHAAVMQRLAEANVSDAVGAWVRRSLSASGYAEGSVAPAAEDDRASRGDDQGGHAEPDAGSRPGAYLRAIEVQAFRGVGKRARLDLTPGPGLTVVSGRNGSGKSSFAEGLEMLFTGALRRWDNRSAVWKGGWDNLHTDGPVEVAAELLVEGTGLVTFRRTWPDRERANHTTSVVPEDAAEVAAFWQDQLATHRPLLAHSELEAMVGKPTDLYKVVASVLGLECLGRAAEWLRQERLQREGASRDVNAALKPLMSELQALDDERAQSCAAALVGTARKWDLDTVEAVAAGAHLPGERGMGLQHLLELAQLQAPPVERVERVAGDLNEAADALAASGTGDAVRSAQLAQLLQAALDHRHLRGEGPCPVCGRPDALDDAWQVATAGEVRRLSAEAAALKAAQEQAAAALQERQRLSGDLPPVLGPEHDSATADLGLDMKPAREAWEQWAALSSDAGSVPGAAPATTTATARPTELRSVAAHLCTSHEHLTAALAKLAQAARDELNARDDRWASLAARMVVWARDARAATAGEAETRVLKQAETWLRNTENEISNDRFRPLADHAQHIWNTLRHESNVDLTGVTLGGGVYKSVEMEVTVDGSQGQALGVMSQGEVNALALSMFIPRATLETSPFRFVVIDDPVQAMDPAKVAGLARALAHVARQRQVVVFSHDDRLPQAIRDLEIQATLLSVTRRAGSRVTVTVDGDPADRALSDAHALCTDRAMPEAVKRHVVGPLCRVAVEAAFTAKVRQQLLADGRAHAEVETAIIEAQSLVRRAALAVYGDARQAGDVYAWLRSWSPRHEEVFKRINRSAHTPQEIDPGQLQRDSRWLVGQIRAYV